MKKTSLLMGLILSVSLFSLGCSISSPSEWCRRGSVWPFKQPAQETAMPVYNMAPVSYSPMPCDPCLPADPCDNIGMMNMGTPHYMTPTPNAGNF